MLLQANGMRVEEESVALIQLAWVLLTTLLERIFMILLILVTFIMCITLLGIALRPQDNQYAEFGL